MSGHWTLVVSLAIGVALLGWVLWQHRHPRVRAWQPEEVDAIRRRARERSEQVRQWVDEPGDPTRAQIDQALDVVAERDQAKAEHTDRAMRRLEGGDEHA